MTSEHTVFEKGGKDQAARRTLFTTFINLVEPKWDGDSSLISIDNHQFGFRKSAGIWYGEGDKYICWDRRLVFWMRAGREGFLPFYDVKGEIVTDDDGQPLHEAAVCTLEVVLRNQALYSIGFLLLPKYKKNQVESIDRASSWRVIGFFPFPNPAPGTAISRVSDCVVDPAKVKEVLLANLPEKKVDHDHNENGFKRSESPMSCDTNKTKRRNIDMKSSQSFKPVLKDDDRRTSCSSMMGDCDACLPEPCQEMKGECKMKDEKKMEDDFFPVPVPWNEESDLSLMSDYDNMSLFHDYQDDNQGVPFSESSFPPSYFTSDYRTPLFPTHLQESDMLPSMMTERDPMCDCFQFPTTTPAYATAAAAAATVATAATATAAAAAAAAAATAVGTGVTPPPLEFPNELNNTENSFSWDYNDMFH